MAQQNKAAFFGRKTVLYGRFFHGMMKEIQSKSGTTQTMVYVFLKPVADQQSHRVGCMGNKGFSLQLFEFGKSGPKRIPLTVFYL